MRMLLGMLPVCALLLHGQSPQSFIRNFPLTVAIDTDHDGSLSAEEIAAAPAALAKLDRNHDGKLTPDEFGIGGAEDAGGPSSDEMVKSLMAFDKNGDGQLQRDEVPERMRGLFDRGDSNHDGVLTQDEIRKMAETEHASRPRDPEQDPVFRKRMTAALMRVVPLLAALDADHNGEMSQAEIQNASAVLKSLDKNGDGRLTDDEVTPDWVRVFVAQGMIQFDTDGDGRISAKEIAAPKAAPFRATLEAADRDHDGYATEDELVAEVRKRADLNHDGIVTQDELQRALQSGALGKPAQPDPK